MLSGRPICLLYSSDGLDMCQRVNLGALYRSLGFRVFASVRGRFDACHLLVVARGRTIAVDSLPKGLPVHIYNYVGYDMSGVIRAAEGNPFVFIAPSSDILKEHSLSESFGVVAFPPVYPDLWTGPLAPREEGVRRYELVHVGNRKRYPGWDADRVLVAFERLLAARPVHVWGHGWDELAERYHGWISPLNIARVYQRTRMALGVMYDLQRGLGTFSSRFWQAPLNGAWLLSEPNRWTGAIPGTLEVDYASFAVPPHGRLSRAELCQTSAHFWTTSTAALRDRVRAQLHRDPPLESGVPKLSLRRTLSRAMILKQECEARWQTWFDRT